MKPTVADSPTIRPFRFASYGARVEITSNNQNVIDRAADVARTALLDNLEEINDLDIDCHFDLPKTKSGIYKLIQDRKRISFGRSQRGFYKFFDSVLRVAVGENAVDRVFLHAGVVARNGKAIIIPADSFKGKTTLVAELVRNGAVYYSDEFAVVDGKGHVHPFLRPLNMRTDDGNFREYKMTVEELGGTCGEEPIPVGMVLITEYVANKRWSPKRLSPGQGVLEMIPYTLSIRRRPEFAFMVLNNIATHAIIVSSLRGSVETFAKRLLDFVDKNVV